MDKIIIQRLKRLHYGPNPLNGMDVLDPELWDTWNVYTWHNRCVRHTAFRVMIDDCIANVTEFVWNCPFDQSPDLHISKLKSELVIPFPDDKDENGNYVDRTLPSDKKEDVYCLYPSEHLLFDLGEQEPEVPFDLPLRHKCHLDIFLYEHVSQGRNTNKAVDELDLREDTWQNYLTRRKVVHEQQQRTKLNSIFSMIRNNPCLMDQVTRL